MSTGIVFDIQRFSLHDGPGIRTTVFLKGCPLHCVWCHNPESRSLKPQMSFNPEKCTHCLACINSCPSGAQRGVDGRHVLKHSLCKLCGKCLNECSYDALKIIGQEWKIEDVLQEVERDRSYYERSKGGMTISGGEPMAQYDFTRELLGKARENGFHNCIETCGFASQEKYKDILPCVDIFLFDYKETDPEKHKKLTGVSNELILSNLDFIYKSGATIILRCPLIPGINDSINHLEGIAVLSAKYPNLNGIEIMPYHNMGKNKTLHIGQEIQLPDLKTTDDETKIKWIEALKNLGCVKAVISN